MNGFLCQKFKDEYKAEAVKLILEQGFSQSHSAQHDCQTSISLDTSAPRW
jgi:transposase-like protein